MRYFLVFLAISVFLPSHVHSSINVDGHLRTLKKAFKEDDHKALLDLNTRVLILADIFNAFDRSHKNLTNEVDNIRSAASTFKLRVSQLFEYKNLSLEYLGREFGRKYKEYCTLHGRIQNGEVESSKIISKMIPYTNMLSQYGEKLNQLYQDEKITVYLRKFRKTQYRMIGGSQTGELVTLENELFHYLNNVCDLAGVRRFEILKKAKLTETLQEHIEKLEKIDPKDLDVFKEQYFLGRILHATRKFFTTIIECAAVLEGHPNPFERQKNTIDDQQSKEYFGVDESLNQEL